MPPRIRYNSALVSGIVLAKIGNPLRDEPLQTSRDVFHVGVINFGFYAHTTAANEHLRAWYLPAILQLRVDNSERHRRLRRARGYYCSLRR